MTRNIYVLLVGIDKYPNPGDRLNGCVNDIEAVEKFLNTRLKYQIHIKKLIDQQATRQAVIDEFEHHLCLAGKDDVVLFYFCGHGSQELAGKEFHVLEYDKEPNKKKLETIVCYDSRTTDENGNEIRDLADKELRYLIANVAKKEPHILVVYDCCHSSSGTRDMDRQERVRRLSIDSRPARPYHDFCFAADLAIAQDLKEGIFPQGEHVFLSACLYDETAKEIDDENGKSRGLFSYFLLKELNSLNVGLSYNDLLNEVKGQVHGHRRDQTPQLEPISMSSQDLDGIAFLGCGDVIIPREPYFKLIYRQEIPEQQSAEWIITSGVSQFLQVDSKLAIYPENCTVDEIKSQSRKLGDVRITDVRLEESVVESISESEPSKDSTYKAVLTKRPLPTVSFYLGGDAQALAQVKEKLANSLVVRTESDRNKPHQYRLYAREQQFEITDSSDRLLVVPIAGNGEYDVNKAVKQVEHIARWTKTRQLENPNSSIPKNAIQIEITYNDKVYTNSDLPLEYVGKQAPKIRLKLKNTLAPQLNQPLYCAILDISDSYAVSILKVFPEGGDGTWICLHPEQVYQARGQARSIGSFIEDIPFGMPQEVINQGFTEYQDVLKLIVSTEPLTNLSQFQQNSLLLADQKSREMLTDPPVSDWMTKQITLTIIREKDSVELTPQAEKILSTGVRVTTPPGLQANATLKMLSSTTRSMSSIALPALLGNTEAFQFSTSRIIGEDASVLELEVNPSTIDAVKPDSPMVISVDRSLKPNELILAVAHDGQFYFPVGIGQTKNGKTEINIEHLCDPQRLNTKEREIRQAIQICFRKVALDHLGRKSIYAWLRKAILKPDGTVSYTNKEDVETVKAAVAKAKNILLYVHGIIGDTESMIPSVRYVKVNANGQTKSLEKLYDLVLAFDYESLNTSIEDTARELKRQLAEVGLEANHGKTLHILAHSMGGLVSRSFIEQGNGNQVVSHLIMVGTPNGGSPWATVHDLATTLLSFGLNLSSVPLVPSVLEKLVEAMSVTLREMHTTKSSFINELKAFTDPKCPYSIIAGSTALMDQASEVKQLLDALKKKMRRAIALPFGDAENDIAVAVSSIIDVPKGRSPAVYIPAPIACDHLSYFRQPAGLDAIANAIGRAFGYPPEPLPPNSPPSPPVSSGSTTTTFKNAPTQTSASTNENSSVQINIGSQTAPSPTSEFTQISPPSNPKHATQTTTWFDTTYVLAIGINKYKSPIGTLDNAVNDAEKIYELFDEKCLRSGENIKPYVLTDDQATFVEIQKQLETLKNQVKPNDRLIFYYAGHGIALHGQEAKDQSQQKTKSKPRGYLIPFDAEMEGRKNYLSMDQLLDWLGEIPCRHCLIILDCCYAGSVQWSLDKTREALLDKVYPTVLDNYINKNAWFILTSSDENETANDGEPIELNPEEQLTKNTRGSRKISNSPFVRCLHDALVDGKADTYPEGGDKIITTSELETYLNGEVTKRTSQGENLQTPQRFKLTGKHGGGEFVFLLNDFEKVREQLPKDPDVTADHKNNPYRGLESFTEKDKDCFFGRKRVTEELFNHVAVHQLTVVVGASGSGKSSLVKAGLIPKFKEEFQKTVLSQSSQELNIVAQMRPGQSPADILNERLKELNQLPGEIKRLLIIDQFEEIETQCHDKKKRKEFWQILIKQLKNSAKNLQIVLTLREDFEVIVRGQFESAINEYNQSKSHKDAKFLSDWVAAKFIVRAMEREELEEAIEQPAKEMAVLFTSESNPESKIQRLLIQQIVDEVAGTPGALPLLSFALYTMYRNFARRYVNDKEAEKTPKREITWEDYESLGVNGVPGALTKRATEEYDNLVHQYVEENGKKVIKKDAQGEPLKVEKLIAQARQEMVKWLMLRMVTLDGGQIARRRVLKQELEYDERYNRQKSEQLHLVVDIFEQARLLVSKKEYVEPAHDALILKWEQLQGWIQEEKGSIILRDRVIPDINDWQKLKNSEKPWHFHQHLLNALGKSLDWTVEQFGVKGELKRLNKQQIKNAKRQKSFAASKNGDFAGDDINLVQETAETASENSPSNQETNESNATVTVQKTAKPGLKNFFSKEAKAPTALSQTQSNNTQYLRSSDRLWDKESRLEVLGLQLGKLRTAKDSWLNKTEADFVLQSLIKREKSQLVRNGFLSIVGFALVLLTVWALNEQRRTQIEQVRTSQQSAEANLRADNDLEATLDILRARQQLKQLLPFGLFQPESELASVKGTMHKVLYQVKERNRLQTNRGSIYEMALSADNKKLATVGKDDTVILWDIGKDEPVDTIRTGQRNVYTVAFSPDQKQIATGGSDSTVKLWDISEKGNITPFKSHRESIKTDESNKYETVYSVVFLSKDKLATIGEGDKVKVWDTISGKMETEVSTKQNNIKNLAFSDKKKLLAIVGGDNQVRLCKVSFVEKKVNLCDTPTNYPTGTSESKVETVAFTRDNRLAIGTEDGTIKLWDVEENNINLSQTKPNEIKTNQDIVYSIVLFSDGKLATVGADDTVILRESSGNEIKKIQPPESSVRNNSVALSLDGKLLATGGDDGTVRLWDSSGKRQRRFKTGQKIISSVEFSPDGKQLITAGQEDETVVFSDTNTGAEKQTISTGQKGIVSVVFDPNNRAQLGTIGVDGTFKVWNVSEEFQGAEKKPTNTINTNLKEVKSAVFTPDTTVLITLSKDGKVQSWKNPKKPTDLLANFQVEIASLALSPDGQKMAIGGADGTVWQWDNTSKEPKLLLRTQQGSIEALAFTPNGELATVGEDNTVRLWEISGNVPVEFSAQEDVHSMAFNSDSKNLVTVGRNGTARLWDSSGNQIKQIQVQKDVEYKVAFSADNKLAFAGSDGTVRLLDASGNQIAQEQTEQVVVMSVMFSLDSKVLITIGKNDKKENTLKLWSVEEDGTLTVKPGFEKTNDLKNIFRDDEEEVSSVAFNPENNLLVVVGDNGTVKVQNISKNNDDSFLIEQSKVSSVAFSYDGKLLATVGEDGSLRLGDTSGTSFDQIQTLQGKVTSVVFSPDSKLLATIGEKTEKGKTTVRLWQILENNRLRQFKDAEEDIYNVAFSPDGKLLATFGKGNIVSLLQVGNEENLLGEICGFVRDYLKNSSNLEDSDRHLCDGFNQQRRTLKPQIKSQKQQNSNVETLPTPMTPLQAIAGDFYGRGQDKVNRNLIDKYTQTLKRNPNDVNAYINRGVAYYRLGGRENPPKYIEEAIEDYTKAIKISPKNIQAFVNRGIAYSTRANQTDQEKAITDYNQVIDIINPKYGDAYISRGIAYSAQYPPEHDKAIEDYKKAITINKNDANAYYALGYRSFITLMRV